MGALTRAGLVPRSYLLTTRGRKTGQPRTNPVVLVEHDGRRWLVAPYGPVSWVHNARAAGRLSLTRRRDTRDYTIREVPPDGFPLVAWRHRLKEDGDGRNTQEVRCGFPGGRGASGP